MGVKSTVTLTRAEACERIIDLLIQKNRLRWTSSVGRGTNTDIEDLLEHLNDEANNGEGFENYIISG